MEIAAVSIILPGVHQVVIHPCLFDQISKSAISQKLAETRIDWATKDHIEVSTISIIQHFLPIVVLHTAYDLNRNSFPVSRLLQHRYLISHYLAR